MINRDLIDIVMLEHKLEGNENEEAFQIFQSKPSRGGNRGYKAQSHMISMFMKSKDASMVNRAYK